MSEIDAKTGLHFDPDVVDVFLGLDLSDDSQSS